MSASRYIGRVGALAVFLGVSAAGMTLSAAASADTGSTDSPGSRASHSNAARSDTARSSRPAHRVARGDSGPNATAAVPDLSLAGVQRRSPAPVARAVAAVSPRLPVAAKQAAASTPRATAAVTEAATPAAPAAAAKIRPATPALAALQATTVASQQINAARQILGLPRGVFGLVFTIVPELLLASAASVINVVAPTPTRPTPTLTLNGYDLVPSSQKTVTSFYGVWTSLPGAPNLVQGQQQFDVVDRRTGATVGSFDALVSTGTGYNYTSLLVTANDGAEQAPPVGSLITRLKIGPFGWSYTATPSDSGDVVKFKLLTPLGNIPLPLKWDGAAGIADHTFDNRPVKLTNGYYIAPADPQTDGVTGTSGILPLWTAIQGKQTYNIYDSNNEVVGSFEGAYTTTADILGTYTQLIQVTGTGPGDVPPVGSVYNVVYGGNDDNYVLYTSLPSPSGTVVTVEEVTPDGITNSPKTFLDASTRPILTLKAPNGHTFVPTSALEQSGANGLPPREMQVQGYQTFDVYDSAGNKLGSVDAAVYTQWDLLGNRTEALLINNVTQGTAGSGRSDVPPVGSVLNFVSFGNSGFGTVQSVMPGEHGDVTITKLVTPLGRIPVFGAFLPVPRRGDVSFYDPFATV